MKSRQLLYSFLGLGALLALPSCLDDNDSFEQRSPTAIVTVCPSSDGGFMMQLNDSVRLKPSNMKASPFGEKEVRALVNYRETGETASDGLLRTVEVSWLDSIRTKLPVESADEQNDRLYGKDPIEIVRDWVTVAEDGYLTLRVRTLWGAPGSMHVINLLTGTDANDANVLELRHDAKGDTGGRWGDALIAFNLNGLRKTDSDTVKFRLRWKSFEGDKTIDFGIRMRPAISVEDARGIEYSASVE